MFITILHGDHEKTLFNSHCKVEALLNSIKQCCGCEPEGMIELADESGQLKNLLQYPHLYASELLKPRETYIPFAVTRPEGSSEPVFVALLKDDEVIDSKFLAALRHVRNSNSPVPEKQLKPGKTKRKTLSSEALIRKAN